MKKILVLVVVLSLCIVSNAFAQSCSTIGARDCRVTNPGKCHWWVCDGKSKQWIFSGQSCTCPRSDSSTIQYATSDELPTFVLSNTGFVLAQKQYLCQDRGNVELIKTTAKKCIPEARIQDPQFTAFINPDTCNFDINGGYNQEAFWAANRVFHACMKENGIGMSYTPNR